MATPNQRDFLAWLKRALDQNQVEISPILDSEGRVLSIGIVTKPGGGLAGLPDPRRVRPDDNRRVKLL